LLYLARSACLPSGLYILPTFFFFIFLFLVVDYGATSSQELLDGYLRTFHGLVELYKGLINLALTIAQGTLPWQPTKVENSAFFTEKFSLSPCHSETDWNVRTTMGSLEAH